MASTVALSMPPTTAVPIAIRLAAPAPVAIASGKVPNTKAIEVIRMGRSRSCAALIAACAKGVPASKNALANSTIRIAFLTAKPTVVSSPNRPAFIEGRQAKQDHGERDGIERAGLRARLLLLVGEAGPFVADARGQLGRHSLHRRHRCAGAAAGGGRAQDLEGGQVVIAFDLLRAGRPGSAEKGVEGNHVAGAIAHVPAGQIRRQHARVRLALHIDLFYPSIAHELVHVLRAERALNGRVQVADRDGQRVGLFAVDVQVVLRRVLEPVRTHGKKTGIPCRHSEKLVAGGQQLFMPKLSTIFQLQVEAGGVAELHHCWQVEDNDLCVAAVVKMPRRPGCDHRRRLRCVGPLGPILELDDEEAGILGTTGEVEAGNR